jgi:hypothetical protein
VPWPFANIRIAYARHQGVRLQCAHQLTPGVQTEAGGAR